MRKTNEDEKECQSVESLRWTEKEKISFNRAYNTTFGKEFAVGKDSIIVSKNIHIPLNGKEGKGSSHIFAFGGSGSGKTSGVILPNLMQAAGSYIVIDHYGDLLKRSFGKLKEEGYNIKILDFSDPQISDGYNPLSYIRNEEDVLELINCLIENTMDKGDINETRWKRGELWERGEVMLLSAVFFFLLNHYEAEKRTLAEAYRIVSLASEHGGEFDKMFEKIREQNADDVAVMHYDIFRLVPDSITLAVCTTVAARLADFNAGPADNLCDCDTVGIDKIGDRKTAVFLTGFYTFEKQKALVPIFCMQAFRILTKHAAYECDGCRLTEHVTMLLDDLHNIGYIHDLDRILSTCRKYGLIAVMTAHSMEQMRFLYKEKAEVVLITCEAIVFMDRLFLPYNDFSLEYIRGRLGRTLPLINQEKRLKKKDLSLAPKQILLKKLSEIQDNSCLVLVNGMPAILDEKIIPAT